MMLSPLQTQIFLCERRRHGVISTIRDFHSIAFFDVIVVSYVEEKIDSLLLIFRSFG